MLSTEESVKAKYFTGKIARGRKCPAGSWQHFASTLFGLLQ
jgi:hypothetical protein